MSSLASSTGHDDAYYSESEDSNADLYTRDLPLEFASRLTTLKFTAESGRLTELTGSELEDPDTLSTVAGSKADRNSPEPPYSPSVARKASWRAIDAATAERRANIQEDIATQEYDALKRCLELREGIYRTAVKGLRNPEPLIIPEPWMISEAPLQRLAEHPFLLEHYLDFEQDVLKLIELRKEFLRYQIRNSSQLVTLPQFRKEMKRLTLTEKRQKDIRSCRLLVDLLLDAFRNLTGKLLIEMTEGDETKKTPLSELCYRLLTHSDHPDYDGELMIADQNIEDMEREHLPWRCNALDCSLSTSPTSSMCQSSPVPARSSPPAVEILLPPSPPTPPTPTKDTPLKDPARPRVKFEEYLPTRMPHAWRKLRRSRPSISSSHKLLSSPPSQHKPRRAARTEKRGHCRNTKMSHLTHPIVMMAIHPQYPIEFPPPPRQPTQPGEEQTPHSRPSIQFSQMSTPSAAGATPKPVDSKPGTNSFSVPFGSSPTPTQPEASPPQDAWAAATGSKRRASEDIRSRYYDEPKQARVSSVSQTEAYAQHTPAEDNDAAIEPAKPASPSRSKPTPRMAAALARAIASRDERQKKAREQGVSRRGRRRWQREDDDL